MAILPFLINKFNIMKKTLLVVSFTLSVLFVFAQVKKYPLIEHYTNTRCSSCGGNNPGFYAKVGSKINKTAHHVAYHPSFPYSSCLLYKANTSENDARANFNGANFTPSYILNGKGGTQSVTTFTDAMLTAEAAKTSPLEVKVKEISGVASWTANIKLKSYGALSGSNYALIAMLCERTLDYASPNGEKVHYDVFRKMITKVNGDPIATMPAVGKELEFNLDYKLDASWKASEMYVLAWVVDVTTKEVINSGTKFSTVVGTNDLLENENVTVFPNPTHESVMVDLSKSSVKATDYQVINALGQVVLSGVVNQEVLSINIAGLPINTYFIKINSKDGAIVRTVVKN
jgi:hypothetical protein